MAIITNVTSRGASVTSSLAGGLLINENSGELVIRNGSRNVLILDKTGFRYFDTNGIKRISIGQNAEGQQQVVVFGANGLSQILIGQDPSDGKPIIAVAEDGKDVIEELNG